MSLPGALRLALLLLTSPTLGHAADAPASPPPKAKTVIGPTGAVGVPLLPGKPIGVAVGVQTIVPVKSWRFAAEVFVASPATAFAPAIGGDVGVGLVDRNGLGLLEAGQERQVADRRRRQGSRRAERLEERQPGDGRARVDA